MSSGQDAKWRDDRCALASQLAAPLTHDLNRSSPPRSFPLTYQRHSPACANWLPSDTCGKLHTHTHNRHPTAFGEAAENRLGCIAATCDTAA